MLKIIQSLIPDGILGSSDNLVAMNGVTIHDTGNTEPGTGAKWHSKYLKSAYARDKDASWHFAVDDSDIIQSIPIGKQSWHCGKTKGNQTTISIEICINPDSNLTIATDKAAELAAHILKISDLEVEGNLYQHHDWSGKDCPSMLRQDKPYSWNDFILRVIKYYGGEKYGSG
jgi:N-acetylmuramoyl-L-alanine amidase CwlA